VWLRPYFAQKYVPYPATVGTETVTIRVTGPA